MSDLFNITTSKIIGMLIFLALGVGFIIWASSFRKKSRELMKNKKYFLMFSGVLLGICIITLIANGGVNKGLDFTGGTMLQLAVEPRVTIPEIRTTIEEYAATTDIPQQFIDPKIQMAAEEEEATQTPETDEPELIDKNGENTEKVNTGVENTSAENNIVIAQEVTGETEEVIPEDTKLKEQPSPEPKTPAETMAPSPEPEPDKTKITGKFRRVMIQVKEIPADKVNGLIAALREKLGNVELMKVETIGPTIGQELTSKALWALIIALSAQLLYITFRFGTQLRYGIAADVALIHDLIIMVGVYTLFGKQVDLPFVAALLTIIGYSVMDTVVVFDRVRENLKLMRGNTFEETVNTSLNQVMTRTTATSFTTIITLFTIYYFGGATLKNFAFALLIGAIAGTYSSLFVASPLIIMIDEHAKKKEQSRVEDRRAKLEEKAKKKAERKDEKSQASEDKKPETEKKTEEPEESSEETSEKPKKKKSRKRRR
ncbi:MAG: protein translocase subunit SecF [Vulcanimicrobiota bacterium]